MGIEFEPSDVGVAPPPGFACVSGYWRGYWFFGFYYESHGPA